MKKFFIVAIVLISMVGGVGAVANNTTTATPVANNTTQTATPVANDTTTENVPVEKLRERISSGPYDYSYLTKNGDRLDIEQAPSTRALGDPPMGFVALRYRNPTLIDAVFGNPGAYTHVERDQPVRQNELQIMGSAFGELTGEYTFKVVFWQRETQEVQNVSVPYAANQSVMKATFSLSEDELYSFQNVSLPSHTQQTWKATAWVEQNGEPLDGVRWLFIHRSNPESKQVNIDSASGAWGYALRNAVFPGIASLIVGLAGARFTLRKTGRGPGYGISTWIFTLGFVGLIVSLIAYYQIAVILANMPIVMGGSIGVVAYTAGLTFHPSAKKVAFLRRELNDVVSIPGGATREKADGGELFESVDGGAEKFDEFTEALFVDLPEVPAVRTEDGYRVPVTGVGPFIARLFADAALLDVENIATRQKVRNGRIDDIIVVDPDHEKAVEHKAATLKRVLPWDTLDDDPTWVQELTAAVLTIGVVCVPPVVGAYAFDMYLNLPIVGFVVGGVVTIALAYTSEDGWIDFEAAPPHFQRAEDSLTYFQRAYKHAKEDQEGKQEAWEERARTAREAREERTEENTTVTEELMDMLGAEKSSNDDA